MIRDVRARARIIGGHTHTHVKSLMQGTPQKKEKERRSLCSYECTHMQSSSDLSPLIVALWVMRGHLLQLNMFRFWGGWRVGWRGVGRRGYDQRHNHKQAHSTPADKELRTCTDPLLWATLVAKMRWRLTGRRPTESFSCKKCWPLWRTREYVLSVVAVPSSFEHTVTQNEEATIQCRHRICSGS